MAKQKQAPTERPGGGGKSSAQRRPDERLSWRFHEFDWKFPPSGGGNDPRGLIEVLKRLAEVDKMTDAELRRDWDPRQYAVEDVSGISSEAQKRLRTLGFREGNKGPLEMILRIRVGSAGRIYAIPPDENSVVHVLWWDPEHEIWPTGQNNRRKRKNR